MKVKVCKNCSKWRRRGEQATAGYCYQQNNENILTLDMATCSAFAYSTTYASDDAHNGGGGDDDGPVDITPRGPGGLHLEITEGGSGQTFEQWERRRLSLMKPKALVPSYDPDGDKKD